MKFSTIGELKSRLTRDLNRANRDVERTEATVERRGIGKCKKRRNNLQFTLDYINGGI